ncbi:MAG: DNA internalization-related competence protein ComEC/Rec2 [Acidobacteria bacterium]|nr:DNA internalization-related competence protein ComEC/Rec2 [Acidobacteriota bacterium]
MRVPAAVAAAPLLTGAAAGVLLVDLTPERFVLAAGVAAWLALLAGCGFLADRIDWAVVASVSLGCALTGFSLGASSARELYAPSLLGWFDPARASEAGAPVEDRDPVIIEGRLREDAAAAAYGALLVVDVGQVISSGNAHHVRGGVRVTVGGAVPASEVERWRAGRLVRASVLLRRPTTFQNPGVPDETRALTRRGIALVGSVKSAALVEVVADGSALDELSSAARAWVRGVIARHVGREHPKSAAIAVSILIGDRTGLPEEDERRLQDAGTYHVIAISGGNIAILTAVLIYLARAFHVDYRAAAGATIVLLLFYAEVAGGSPSVSRAVAAAILFLAAMIVDHRGAPLNVVAVAAVLGVAVSPVSVFDAGFLLSFGATAGIILGAPRVITAVEAGFPGPSGVEGSRPVTMRLFVGVLAATLCAEIAIAPVAASFFARITAAGLVVNFAAIPLMTVVQCSSMALLALSPLSGAAAGVAATVVHLSATGLVESSRFVDLAPWLARDVAAPAWWLCVLYYGVAASLLLRPTRVRFALLGIAALCIAAGPQFAARGVVPPPGAGQLRVVVLDVGQGDATVIVPPGGDALLVDAGGLAGTTFDIGNRVVIPTLRALGVARLHAMVITHADPDHAGGAEVVLQRLRPANVWEGVPVPPHPALKLLHQRADEQRIVWRTVRPGDIERAGPVEIRVLHPPAPDWERQRVRNDDSVVMEVRYRDVSILLPGDIGREVEQALIPGLQLAPLVILKAAHHGSATSSSEEFLEATRPAAVIFSAGKNNRFGHPARQVVERFRRRGVEMFNTAHDGAVFIETDGKQVEVRGWLGRVSTFAVKPPAPTASPHDGHKGH